MTERDGALDLDWRFKTGELGKDGREVRLQATPDQCAALAKALELSTCHALRLDGRLTPLSRGRCRLAGKLVARVEQTCVISLEPIEATVTCPLDLEFWPEPDIAAKASASFDAMAGEDHEPLDGDIADLGRLAYELVGAGLDPFPRKPDASFAWQDPADRAAGKPNPFAILEKLKPKN